MTYHDWLRLVRTGCEWHVAAARSEDWEDEARRHEEHLRTAEERVAYHLLKGYHNGQDHR